MRSPRRRTVLFGLGGAIVIPALLVMITGCGMRIRPPAAPADPVSVWVLDYGRHTSLLLPAAAEGTAVEFAYGSLEWYGLNNTHPGQAAAVVFLPCEGTMGRAGHPSPPGRADALCRAMGLESAHEVRVSRRDCDALRGELESRFLSGAAGPHGSFHNPETGLVHVWDGDGRYNLLLRNCNQETAGWLGRLGCRVGGLAITADVTVVE